MKYALLFLLVGLGLQAGDLQFFVHTPGTTPDGPAMGATYAFPDTALGASSSVYLRLKNTSTTQVYLVRTVFTGDTSYAVDGSVLNNCLGLGEFEDLTITFAPASLGASSTPVQIAYLAYPTSTGCPTTPPLNFQTATLATLAGNAVAPTLTTTMTIDGTTSPISSNSTISFGQVSVGAQKTATFTVSNGTATTLPLPTPAIVASVFSQPPYSLGPLTNWPSSLDPGGSASFTLSFAPTVQALVTATLTLGSRSYPLTGTGAPGPGLDSLLVSYTLPTGVHYNITRVNPVDFGSVQTSLTASYIFTITNPATNFASQTIASISLSGAGFALTSLPTLPVTLKPGDTTNFTVAFAPSQAGAQSATLAIGTTLQFTLTGKGVAPALNPSIQLSPSVLSSGQQAQVSVALSGASPSNTTGTLTVSFISAVSGVTDDPAVVFVSSGTRTANINFVTGASSGSFANGQNNLTFQTGTTVGTLKFVLSFANGQTVSKSVDIAPDAVQFVSSTATKQSPYLVINVSGYDNTYSAGKILFNFYDTKGTLLTPGGISVDETQDFHNYFFLNNQVGGAFALQAKFPVTGDITTIGAADIMVQNANGQSQTQHLTF